jgi:hypothetical protein
MTMRQSDSEDKLHFRTDRITIENGFYYFTTREGTQEGPFKTHEQAEVAIAVYIRDHKDPTRIASSHNAPDEHYYRYSDERMRERRQGDRRQSERRGPDRRQD